MSVSNKLKIRNLIREAVGVPSDIEMMTSVFTEVVKKLLYSFKSANEPLDEVEIDVKNIGESVMRSGVITIGGEKSWNMVKQSQSFDEKEWKKFPMYKNPIGIKFEIFEEGVLQAVYKTNLNIDASHSFEAKDFKSGDVFDVSTLDFHIRMDEDTWDNLELLSPKLDSVISHELLHAYQLYKRYVNKGQVGFGKGQATNVLVNVINNQFLPEWNNFLHLIYVSLKFEQDARIPQVSHILRRTKIDSYEDFIGALKGTQIFGEIEELRNFSAEELLNSFGKINSIHDMIFKETSVEKAYEWIFEWNDILQKITDHLITTGVSPSKIDAIPLAVRKDPKKFFEYFERKFKFTANNMLKRVSKLYSLR
jgi:hypothetical protein